jgi:hypothetical protein
VKAKLGNLEKGRGDFILGPVERLHPLGEGRYFSSETCREGVI